MPLSKLGAGFVTAVMTALITAAGTIGAAYISASNGLVFFPNRKLSQQVEDLKKKLDNRSAITGDYEWQWAGDNWLGSVTFQNLANGNISARLDMRSVKHNSRTHGLESTPLFRSANDGSATVTAANTLRLTLPMEMTPQFLKMHPSSPSHVLLNAELQPVEAFAGRVQYTGADVTTGDIILVQYRTDERRW
jgi:hypothetical protein